MEIRLKKKSKKSMGKDAKDRILDVSEELFAKGSYASVSVRSVTAEADVNLSAVNYYFGSKQGLFQAVFVRRATQMNHERLGLLYEASERARTEGREVSLKEVLSAMMTTPIFWLYDEEQGLSGYIRFLARAYLEEASGMDNVFREEVEVFDKFVPYFKKLNPTLTEEDIYWRIHFTMGSMHHIINHMDRISLLSHNACHIGTREQTRDRLVEFCCNGFC